LISKSFGKLDYAQAAYWLDLSYLYFLLSKDFILSRAKSLISTHPLRRKILAEEENGSADEAAYLFFQEEGPQRICPPSYLADLFLSRRRLLQSPSRADIERIP
jgi:hypothetical protein